MTKTYPAITRQQKKKNKQRHKGEGIHLIHILLHPLPVQVEGKDHANILTTRAKASHLMRHKVNVHPNNGTAYWPPLEQHVYVDEGTQHYHERN